MSHEICNVAIAIKGESHEICNLAVAIKGESREVYLAVAIKREYTRFAIRKIYLRSSVLLCKGYRTDYLKTLLLSIKIFCK